MTKNELYNAIKRSYQYAHDKCIYAPCVTYPPMEDGKADCVGLVFRALYELGYNKRARNINEIVTLCDISGLKFSTSINDVWKRGGVVLMSPKGDKRNIAHVYYSLGGESLNNISKYDLGSKKRIESEQPFTNVPVNEWTDKYEFFGVYYSDAIYPDATFMDIKEGKLASIKTDTNLYSGPGTGWRNIKHLNKNVRVIAFNVYVTNLSGNKFRYIETMDGCKGFVYYKTVDVHFFEPYAATVRGTDGTLSVRCAAGVENEKIGEIKEGSIVTVWAECEDNVHNVWLNVSCGKLQGFAYSGYLTT